MFVHYDDDDENISFMKIYYFLSLKIFLDYDDDNDKQSLGL